MYKTLLYKDRNNAAVLIVTSVILAAIALIICFSGGPATPVSCTRLPDPQKTVCQYFDLLMQGRYGECDSYLLDFTLSEMDQNSESELSNKMRAMLNDSYSYRLNGEGEITGMTAYLPVTVTYLDLPTFGSAVKEQANVLAEDLNFQGVDIFTKEAALDIAGQALDSMTSQIPLYSVTNEIIVELNYVDSEWKIVYSTELEKMIMGNSTGQ